MSSTSSAFIRPCKPVGSAPKTQPAPKRVNATGAAEAEFERRIADYAKLHKQMEGMLPQLPKDATPQQIDENQRALEKLIVAARANAKPGDFFTPAMQRTVHRLLEHPRPPPRGPPRGGRGR